MLFRVWKNSRKLKNHKPHGVVCMMQMNFISKDGYVDQDGKFVKRHELRTFGGVKKENVPEGSDFF